ncbi:opioid growth factor receptor-like protein 1 isoform X2 [Haliotis rufescens]|uniref:opioid growth factor receptor-like protein 1 isoform X2 n=1 Tax=Haliotis rufescens TaxID=6454 RepID=UPI00201F768C|nr:opioid growth factor receptor-like protein 1 isoform X2 [Haliotis rufescens]
MSSESGDTKEIEDKPESPDNVNTNAEPMVVDGTTNGNEGVEVADDELPQVGSESEQQKKEQKGKTEDEATDETQKADEEELADTQELTEPVDRQKTEEEEATDETQKADEEEIADIQELTETVDRQKTEEEESTRKSDEDIDFEDNSDDLDKFYHPSDSDSEKEIEALREDMGNSKTKDKTKPGKRSGATSYQDSRNPRKHAFTRRWSQKDTEDYRKGYPGKKDISGTLNLEFYTNRLTSRPNGDKIDVIHEKWYGDYDKLESHHGYIQWLFPIRENGMNFYAQELQVKEAEAIRKDPKTCGRVLTSYKMMLDFYGMKLKDDNTGELERKRNWRQRYSHLNRSMHNYLRITRILKSLGELGYEHLKAPFVRFILKEAMEQKTLENTLDSCYNYWIETIKDDKTREELRDFADNVICSDS